MADIKNLLKQQKNVIRQVYKGFTSNTTGGCCGVNLPPAEQAELKRLKTGEKH